MAAAIGKKKTKGIMENKKLQFCSKPKLEEFKAFLDFFFYNKIKTLIQFA